MTFALRLAALCLVLSTSDQPAASDDADWPGLWGPSRNGATAGRLAASGAELEVVWRRPVSGGYSEIAISGGRAVTMELRDGVDYVVAVDADTGREQWRVRVAETYRGHGGSDDGPIATPAVSGTDVFALGPHGHLIAVDAASGTERWRHDLVRAFDASAPTWGFAASPLIEGALVVVPTGGERSRGLLAFDRATGRLVWNAAVAKQTAYASAVTVDIGGRRQIVGVAADRVFAVDPANGRVLWQAPGPGGTIEVSNSVLPLSGGRLLLSNWEESILIEVTPAGGTFTTREVWRTNRLRNANGPTLHRNGFLYGFAGGFLVCMNADTQEIRWRERTGAATLIGVGDEVVLLGQDSGELQVATITPEAFTARRRVRPFASEARAVTGPSYAGGRLYVRNLTEIAALRLR